MDTERGDTVRPLVVAGIVVGIGLGGFVDGIVLHQMLQWHHMLTAYAHQRFPVDTVHGLEVNTLWDGLFHSATWVATAAGLLPDTVRTFVFAKGTIGNTSFVAIPYNAANREGAMVVADFLLEPATQAHAQDFRQMGNFTVLDMAKLTPAERRRFDELPRSPALPTNAELGTTLLEPHPSWMTRIASEWEKRYTK